MQSVAIQSVLVLLCPMILFAQSQVDLKVRAVQASQLVPVEQKIQQSRKIKLSLSEDIQDLRSQLTKLHYAQFKLVSSTERRVSLEQEEVFPIAHAHTLRLKPVSMESDRVCVQMRWLDEEGSEVLNTRLHLEAGESMVTGTDMNDKEDGLVLAIDVKPVP